MGIFNFLKPKQTKLLAFLESNPDFHKDVFADVFLRLENDAANLVALGRQDDARKVTAEFLGNYATKGPCDIATTKELPIIFYDMAFYTVSFLVHRNWAEFIARWNGAVPFQVFLAVMSITKHNKRMPLDVIFEFKPSMGNLTEDIKYYLLKFPKLSPMSTSNSSQKTSTQHKIDAGPYFLVVTHNEISDEKRVYILTRFLEGSTFLHYNSPSKMSICGIGSKPESQAFLDCVSEHIVSK